MMIRIYRSILLCAAVFIFVGCAVGDYKMESNDTPPVDSPGSPDSFGSKRLAEVMYSVGDESYSSLYRISYEEIKISTIIKSSQEGLTKFPEDNYDEATSSGYVVTNFRYNPQNVLFNIIYTGPKEYTEYYEIFLDGTFKAVKMKVVSSSGETWSADFFYLENGYLHSVKFRQEHPDADENIVIARESSLVYTYQNDAVQSMAYSTKDNEGNETETVYNFYGLDFPNKGGIMHPDFDNGFYAMGPLMYGDMMGKVPERLHNKCIYETVVDGVVQKTNMTSSYEFDPDGFITGITRTTEYGDIYPEAALRSASAKSVEKYLYKYGYRE